MASTIPSVPFAAVASAIRSARLPACDLVLGIGHGGTVPASLVAYRLGVTLCIDWYNYRDSDNKPVRKRPALLMCSRIPDNARRILLVDDVSVTGRTLRAASARLANLEVTTMVLKGKADIVLMPHLNTCVHWPWHPYRE